MVALGRLLSSTHTSTAPAPSLTTGLRVTSSTPTTAVDNIVINKHCKFCMHTDIEKLHLVVAVVAHVMILYLTIASRMNLLYMH